MPDKLTDEEWTFIAVKKTLQYRAVEPYLGPTAGTQSEAELRQRVIEAVQDLPLDERRQLRRDINEAREAIYNDETPDPLRE